MELVRVILYSKFIISILSFFGGAGIISFIDSHEARRQHQKDITVKEIRIFTNKLRSFNIKLSRYINDSKNYRAHGILVKMMSYISSWSVNVKFRRIDVNMLKYSSRTLLGQDYEALSNLIEVCLKKTNANPYYDIAKRSKNFFKSCGIIH